MTPDVRIKVSTDAGGRLVGWGEPHERGELDELGAAIETEAFELGAATERAAIRVALRSLPHTPDVAYISRADVLAILDACERKS